MVAFGRKKRCGSVTNALGRDFEIPRLLVSQQEPAPTSKSDCHQTLRFFDIWNCVFYISRARHPPYALQPRMKLQNASKLGTLPSNFTSLYRLFLRTTSAAVLHHPKSTRNLRRIWRPTFNAAASVIYQIRHERRDSLERQKLEHWFGIWNTRSTKSTHFPFSRLTLIYSG